MLLPGVVASQAAAAAAVLTEVSSAKVVRAAVADPWDDTVNIIAGSNRVLLDLLGNDDDLLSAVALDPAGDNIALAALTGSPQAFASIRANGAVLLEANFPGTTGNKTLRADWAGVTFGARRTILLENASQTVFSAGNAVDNNTTLVLSITRPTGDFPIGSIIYAFMFGEAAGAYTVTGDATEVDDDQVSTNRQWVFAKGTLGAANATVSVTFDRDDVGTVQKQGLIIVVEPV